MAGYVYVIGPSKRPQRVKVGISRKHPRTRLRQLQTGSPEELKIYGYRRVRDPRKVERAVHRRLASRHSRLEWFDVRPAAALGALDAELGRPSGLDVLLAFGLGVLALLASGLLLYLDGYQTLRALKELRGLSWGQYLWSLTYDTLLFSSLVLFIAGVLRLIQRKEKAND